MLALSSKVYDGEDLKGEKFEERKIQAVGVHTDFPRCESPLVSL